MLVIFDIDGTLNMTETYGIAAYHKALEQMGADHFTDEQLRDRIGATFTEDVKYFFGERAERHCSAAGRWRCAILQSCCFLTELLRRWRWSFV